ncbi:MAG: energy transducer TonB [Acidobacteriota bacterium]
MIDQVSEELERRAREPWQWRSSLAVALVLHATVAFMAVFAPSPRHTSLRMPSVQVRIGVRLPPAKQPAAGPRADARPSAPRPDPRPASAATKKTAAQSPAPARARAAGRRAAGPEPPPATSGGDAAPPTGSPGAAAVSGTGGLRAGPAGEDFPYAYYLERLLAIIEGAWFRPPAPDGTRCRVLCRIDRSGRILDAGIEQPSAVPAFDRAALRAVYAGAPYPPLPQGFGSSSLTLHLEFGP